MNYLIDIILIAIIALTTFIGYKKGLIKVAFGLISFLLAIVIAVVLYKPISGFIIKYTTLDDKIEQTVESKITSSDNIKDETDNFIANYYSDIKNATTAIIAKNISQTIINIGCMIIVFIISNIILLFFKFSGDLIAKLPLIKQFNSAGGFIYGLLKGFILVYIILALIAIASPVIEMNQLIKMINSSIITNIMYNNNVILILFT